MHKTRSWQDSFDRLEAARREEQFLPDAGQQPISEKADAGAQLVKPEPRKAKTKTAPRKRSAGRKTTPKAEPKLTKPRAARPRKPAMQPALILADALPAAPAEQMLITPLPRSASLTPYRKAGLFGLIGSWLRLASRQVATGLSEGVRRPEAPTNPGVSGDELSELKAENRRLRQQLDALLALREIGAKVH